LRLARPAPRAYAATHARQVGPHAREPWQLILKLGQLHLDASLVGVRPLRKDVQDDAAPIKDLAVERLFQGALLLRRQLVVRHHHVEMGLDFGLLELLGLAGAQVPERMNVVAVLENAADHFAARRLDQ
jgi:hypothetical protein